MMQTPPEYAPNLHPSSLTASLIADLDPGIAGRVVFTAFLVGGLGTCVAAWALGVDSSIAYAGTIALTALVSLALNARGRTRSAVVLMLLAMTVCAFTACLVYQGINDVAASLLPVVIVLAGLTLDRHLLLFFTGFISASVVAISWVRFSVFHTATLDSSRVTDLVMLILTYCLVALILEKLAAYARRSLQIVGESEERFRSLFENATMGMYRTTPAGRIDAINPALVQMLGYESSSDLATRNLTDFATAPDGPPRQTLDREGTIRDRESTWLRRNGEVLLVRESVHAVQDRNGAVRFYEGIVEDITDRKRTEEALRASERRLALALDASKGGLFDWEISTGRLYLSPQYFSKLGYAADEVPDSLQASFTLFHPDDIENCRALIGEYEKGSRTSHELELRVRSKQGEWHWIASRGRTVEWDSEKRPVRTIGIFDDVTDRKLAETELLRRNEFIQAALDNISDGVVACDAAGNLALFNRAARELHGMDALQLPPDQWSSHYDLFGPDGTSPLATEAIPLRRAFLGERFHNAEMTIAAKGRPLRYLQASGSPFYDQEGQKLGAVAAMHDVTERKQAEQALRESEERFRATFEQAAVGIAHVSLEGRFLRINQKFCEIVGYSAEELRKRTFQEITHPEDLDIDLGQRARLQQGEIETYSLEKRYMRADGGAVWINLTVSLVRNKAGNPERFVTVIQDINSRKRAEAALRESEEYLKTAERLTHVGYWHWDLKTNHVAWSDEVFLVFGQPPDFKPGHEAFFHLLVPQDRERVDREIRLSLLKKKGYSMEFQIVRPHGELRTVTCTSELSLDEDGMPTQVFGACQDITDFKRAQEKAFERQKLESVGTLAGGIAHDFNNLMGGVLSQAELALTEIASGSYPVEQLRSIQNVAVRGSEIVRELMIYAGQEESSTGQVDVTGVVEEMLGLLNVSVSKHARLEADLGLGLPVIWANTAQVGQIVMNLVTNASEAIGMQDGVIRVTTRRVTVSRDSYDASVESLDEGDYVQLEVSDTGSGMSVETQAKIYDPFFTTKSGGHGLGMAVVHGIVRSLGGAIHLTSAPGRGSTFRVLLPCAASQAITSPSPMLPISEPAHPSEGVTVLVVEDEEALRQPVLKMLRKIGFAVIEASNGSAALEAIHQHRHRIDLMLLDITLPGASSREVFDEARRLRPETKVIVTSAYNEAQAAASLHANVELFLRKPYRFHDLADLMRRVLTSR